jgi:hypothetical protein
MGKQHSPNTWSIGPGYDGSFDTWEWETDLCGDAVALRSSLSLPGQRANESDRPCEETQEGVTRTLVSRFMTWNVMALYESHASSACYATSSQNLVVLSRDCHASRL